MENRYTKDNKYYQETIIPCYDADASFHLKPAAFMDLAQELAYWAAGELGFGFDDLQTHGTAWVLSRMHIRFTDMPLWRDKVRLITWHKGLEGLFFLRDFRMEDETGKERVACTSSWLVVDAQTHRLMRSDRLENMVQPDTQSPDNAIENSCPKVQLPRGVEAEKTGEHRVSYSDLDILGHTNNARYVVWAMDCIDPAQTADARVKDLYINFIKETRLGDVVELFSVHDADGWTVEGRVEGHPAFCARILF